MSPRSRRGETEAPSAPEGPGREKEEEKPLPAPCPEEESRNDQDRMESEGPLSGKEEKMKETLKIKGMMCEHCERHVKEALEKLPGVENALVSHESGTALLTLGQEIPEETLRKAVEEAGYEFVGIQ